MKPVRIIAVFILLISTVALAEGLNLTPDSLEQDALDAMDAYKWVHAREVSEHILDSRPNDFIALWVLAHCYEYGDGNLIKAFTIVQKLEKRFHSVDALSIDDDKAAKWHAKVLLEEAHLLGLLDRRKEQLEKLREYEAYDPGARPLEIWPLMKLGRYEEAIRLARDELKKDDIEHPVITYNGLIAVYEELAKPEKAIQWAEIAWHDLDPKSAIIASNQAEAYLAACEYDKVAPTVQRSLDAENQDTGSSPLGYLVSLYTLEGKFAKAVSAYKQMVSQGLNPDMRIEFEAEYKRQLVVLLYALGKWKMALQRMELVYNSPNRLGMSSEPRWRLIVNMDTLYWAVLDGAIQGLDEQADARGFFHSLGLRLRKWRLKYIQWRLQREVTRAIIPHIGRFFSPIGPWMTKWYSGALVSILGTGVMRRIAKGVLKDIKPKYRFIYESFLVEAAYLDHEWRRVIDLAGITLGHTPQQEVLLRMRILAMKAQAEWQTGETVKAGKDFSVVLNTYPTVLRFLHIPLPVSWDTTGTDLQDKVTDALQGSPRFVSTDNAPFIMRVSGANNAVRVCLVSAATRDEFTCAGHGFKQHPTNEKLAQFIDLIHENLFSPPIDMSQIDLNTLDGSPTPSTADDLVKGVK